MSPKIEIIREPEGAGRVIADLPDRDGVYKTRTGEDITVEMNPSEAEKKGIKAIALSCTLFLGHRRSTGKTGAMRRVIYLNKHGKGSTDLSFSEKLRVSPPSSPSGAVE